ncbi:MAG: oligosaccharide flippase family protein [Candidatus Eisenbacteria bacterium]
MSPNANGGLARRLARDTMLVASGRGASLLVWLVVTPAILRGLGPESFGIWSLYFALTSWLGALDMGFSQLALRSVAAARARGDQLEAGEFATLSALGYVVLGLLWWALSPLLCTPALELLRVPEGLQSAARFAFYSAPVAFILAGSGLTVVMVLQACERFDLAAVANLGITLSQAVGILFALHLGLGLPGVLGAVLLSYAIGLAVALLFVAVGAPGFRWASPLVVGGRFREALRFGGPLQLANVLAVAHQQVDKLLLARFAQLALVAPYELGLRLATTMSSIPQMALSAVAPAAAAMHAREEHERSHRLFERANRFVMSLTAVLAAALLGGGARLLEAWLGYPNALADVALSGLVVAAFFALASSPGAVMARAAGRTDLEVVLSATALIVHLMLAAALIPRYQLLGAVAATALGNAVGAVVFLGRLARVMRWSVLSVSLAWLVPLIACAAGAVCGRGLESHAPLAAGFWRLPSATLLPGVSALAALVVLVAMRFITREDLAGLRALSRVPVGVAR